MTITNELLIRQVAIAEAAGKPTVVVLKVEEDSSSGVTYIGTAEIGTATSDAFWKIQKITKATVGTVTTTTITFPHEGGIPFPSVNSVFIWDNRATYTYS